MYDRDELEKVFIKKKGVSDGDWLLRVQSTPFFVADRYGFDLKSSIIISKGSIAEFVENQAIQDLVCELGIEWSQGYHFSKPGLIES